MKKLIPLALATLCPATAMAIPDVSVSLNVIGLVKKDGVTPLPMNSLLVLMADVDGDGFGDLTQGKLLSDPDDRIILTFGTNDGNPIPNVQPAVPGSYLNNPPIVFNESGLEGKNFQLVWYDKLFNPSNPLANPGFGVDFGVFRHNGFVGSSDLDWVIDTGETGSIFLFLPVNDPLSNLTVADLTASQSTITIPEPATTALLFFASAGLLSARFRRSTR